MNFDKIKDRVAYKLVNREKCRYLLEDIPHTDFLDLTFVYYIIVHMDDMGVDTVLIRNEYLDEWGISDTELFEISAKNFNLLFNMQLAGVSGDEMQSTQKLIMATTKYKMFGAVYMADLSLIGAFSEIFDDDVCIIPSSVHEIILMPASGINREDMDSIIQSVNEEAVREDEYLSDHMYLYEKKERRIVY